MARNDNRLKNGSLLGTYKIIRLIGEGGMGEVYEAKDETLNRQVALKVISPELSNAREIISRFKTEGQTLARLNHQNVVSVYTLGEDKGIHYIVMEYVDGHSLSELVKLKGALQVHEALHYFRQLIAGVEALHNTGIIHRDIKPKNIIIRRDNSVKIVDFGIAKIEGQPERELTVAGELLGSIYYIAPEVIDGEVASVQSDIWSLGINLYEILTGEKPFDDEKWSGLVHKITTEDLMFDTEKSSRIPEPIQDIILKMVEKNPSARYRSVKEVIHDIDAIRNPEITKSSDAIAVPPPNLESLKPVDKAIVPSTPNVLMTREATSQTNSHPRAVTGTARRRTSTSLRTGPKKHSFVEWFGIAAIVAGAGWLGTRTYQKYTNSAEESATRAVPEVSANQPATSPAENKITCAPSLPASGQAAWVNEQKPLVLSWSGEAGVLEIARDPAFREVVFEADKPTSPLTVRGWTSGAFEDGEYFWRLSKRSGSGKEALSEVVNFHLVTPTAPHVLYPVTQMTHSSADAINFYWQEKPAVKMYRFQVSFDSGFQKLLTDQLLKETKINYTVAGEGMYFWRVRGEDVSSSSQWSDVRTLRIQKNQTQSPEPKPLAQNPTRDSSTVSSLRIPANSVKVMDPKAKTKSKPLSAPKITHNSQDLNLKSGAPTLAWSKTQGARGYEVQVSKSAQFHQVEWTQTVSGSQTKWASAQPGKYFWRVRAVDANDSKGAFSAISKLNLKAPPAPKVVKTAPASAPTPVAVQAPVQAPVADRAPAKAKSAPASKKATAGASASEEENLMPTPKLKLPPDGVSIVSLNGTQNPISFKWEKLDVVESYRLEISTTENFSQVIFSTVVRENRLLVTQALPLGKLYWRIRSESSGSKSDWSSPYSFEITK